MKALEGQVGIVTGSSSGIGLAIARGLAAEGMRVVLAARRADKLEAAVTAIVADGGQAVPILLDVTSEASVAAVFAEVDRRFGRLDLLVNNAGTLALTPLDELTVEDFDRVIATNLRGPFLCARAALRMMKPRQSGRIINIGSLSAHRVRPNNGAYNASKFGLEGLTHSLALEARPFGIAISALHPGTTVSEITERNGVTEPMVPTDDMARVAVLMASLPHGVNLWQAIVHPTEQQFIGRG